MICYKDKTFCPFSEACASGKTCDRALTDKVQKDAQEWWGDHGDPPICVYTQKPDCFKE